MLFTRIKNNMRETNIIKKEFFNHNRGYSHLGWMIYEPDTFIIVHTFQKFSFNCFVFFEFLCFKITFN